MELPTVTIELAGVTVIVLTAGVLVTVIVEVPDLEEFVAVIVHVPEVPATAVTRPLELTVHTEVLFELQV